MEKGQVSVAYEMLRQEEDFSPSSNTTSAAPPQGIPPPAYDELLEGGAVGEDTEVAGCTTTNEDRSASLLTSPKGYTTIPVPPPYNVAAAELPTYEEAQRSKGLEGENQRQSDDVTSLWSHSEEVLGTDFLFFTSFFVAFLFNWVGFLLLVCFCQTLAGRYGALAGFGLSLAKWTLIVKHSTDLVSSENEWLWWIIMAFGILICARSCLQYIQVKREWRLLNPLRREGLYFLY